MIVRRIALFVFVTAVGCDGSTNPTPTIASISPSRVLARDTGVLVNVEGAGLNTGVKVDVAGVLVDPLFASGSNLTFKVPDAATLTVGVKDVAVVSGSVRSATVEIEVVDAVRFRSVAGSARMGCALSQEDEAYCWGDTFGVQGPGGGINIPAKIPGGLKFVSLGANPQEGCGLTSSGSIYCWPLTVAQGQARTPVLKPMPAVASLAIGHDERCGLTAGGETWCWNNGENPVPRRITTVPPLAKLSSGYHLCGLTSDGTAYCWGPSDSRGQLGGAPGTPQPVLVSSTIKFTDISAGQVHSCAVATSGTTYCWGDNQYGELGVGDLSPRTGPVQVSTTETFASVVAGNLISCGLNANKTAYCWGSNTFNILGTGTTIATQKPTQPIAYFKVVSLSSGAGLSQTLGDEATTCAVTDDYKLFCWGFDVGIKPRRMDPAMSR